MTTTNSKLPIILAITGASGAVYGLGLLEFLLANDFQVELVYSENAREVAYHELGIDLKSNESDPSGLALNDSAHNAIDKHSGSSLQSKLSKHFSASTNASLKEKILCNINEKLNIWDSKNIAASISSGSYRTAGMIIAPASMGTIANIACGTSNNLIARAADVVLKERRRLVLVARETPLSTIHLRNMLTLSEMGAVVLPAAPGFYHHPRSIQDQINFVLGKTLDAFGLDHELFTRWTHVSQLDLHASA